ncbi:MAG: zinc ribbon domain-containing protein [Promethearchaeota archaeon]
MGLWRVMWTGCLGMLCLVPMAWFSFNVLDLGAAITGDLFIGIGDAMDTAFTAAFAAAGITGGFLTGFVPFIVQGLLGIVMLWYFPLHWALYYRPDDIGMALAIVLPWMLTGTITAALFCKKARKGFTTGISVGLAYALFVGVFPLIISAIVNAASPIPIDIMGVINSLFTGMTDLPYVWSVVLACVEGGLISGIFGALIGSLKYKPEGQLETQKVKKARKKKKEPKIAAVADTTGYSSSSSSSGMSCPNCSSKVIPGDPFCPNCGTKL